MAAAHDKITERKVLVHATWNHSWSGAMFAAEHDINTRCKQLGNMHNLVVIV